jgi:hypothetical protein
LRLALSDLGVEARIVAAAGAGITDTFIVRVADDSSSRLARVAALAKILATDLGAAQIAITPLSGCDLELSLDHRLPLVPLTASKEAI